MVFLGHMIRASGSTLRQDLSSDVTPEEVKKKWSAVTDMSSAEHFDRVEVHKQLSTLDKFVPLRLLLIKFLCVLRTCWDDI